MQELNPFWILALAVVLLAFAANALMQRHVRDSQRLQARLTGTALQDALRLYAEATPADAPARPRTLAELADDNRQGLHRNWLDADSAAMLADRQQFELLRDASGQLKGARRVAGSGGGWLPAWLQGDAVTGADRQDYVLEDAQPAPEPEPQVESTLPQPVMPDTPALALKADATLNGGTPAAAASPAKVAVQAPALGNPVAQDRKRDGLAEGGLKPSRIIAALEAQQVLRLTSSEHEEATILTPRRNPAAPAAAAPAAGAGAPAGGASARAATSGTAVPGGAVVGASAARASGKLSGKPQSLSKRAAPARLAKALAPPRSATPIQSGTSYGSGAASPSSGPPVPSQTASAPAPALAAVVATPSANRVMALPPGKPLPDAQVAAPSLVPATPAASSADGMDGTSPVAASRPPSRLDTVIYEESQAPSGDAPTVNCRALAGDSVECDALEDSDPQLYQRCYQSLSERINACLAGEPVPPLLTR